MNGINELGIQIHALIEYKTFYHFDAVCTWISWVTILSTSYILVRNVGLLTQYWNRVSAQVVFLHYLRRTNLWSRRQRKFSKKLVKLTGSDRALWAIREEIATFSEFYFLSRKVQASETTRTLLADDKKKNWIWNTCHETQQP